MQPLRSPLRWWTVALLLVTAVVHVPLVPEHLEEAPYIGVLFVVLSIACVALSVLLVLADTPAVWAATAVVTVLAVGAFLLSRTVGLPALAHDVGNWTEPLGFPAVLAEMVAALVAAYAFSHRTSIAGRDHS